MSSVWSIPDAVDNPRGRLRTLGKSAAERVGRSEGSLIAYDVYFAEHVHLGRDDKLWISRDGGARFGESYTFSKDEQVAQFAQSRQDPDLFYVFAKAEGQQMNLYPSVDGGLRALWGIADALGGTWRGAQ